MTVSGPKDGGVFIVDAGVTDGAFERLQSGAREALATRSERTLVDLGRVDPVDGAMLVVLVRMAQSVGASRRLAVVVSEDTMQLLTEWRLDAVWLSYLDRDAALESLFR